MELPQSINNWTILRKTDQIKNDSYLYECLCKCGTKKLCAIRPILRGLSKSCGCYKNICITLTGKDSREVPEYNVWGHMKRRCSGSSKNKGDESYARRGIKVCERWIESFENFYNDMGPRPSDKHSLDRIDNNGNYEPGNCRWATSKEQANNTSKNMIIEYNGEVKTLTQWANFLNVSVHSLRDRIIRYGFSIEDAFNKEYLPRESFCPQEFTVDGETLSIEVLCEKFGLTKKDVISRFHKDWTDERIFKTPIMRKQNVPIKEITFNNKTMTIAEWAEETEISDNEIRKRLIRGWTIERTLTQPMRKRLKNP